MSETNGWTHGYVATMGCGCGVGICVDDPWITANELDLWRDEGLMVTRMPMEDCRAAFLRHCERYPHTPWQKRNEAAKAKRQLATALSDMFAEHRKEP